MLHVALCRLRFIKTRDRSCLRFQTFGKDHAFHSRLHDASLRRTLSICHRSASLSQRARQMRGSSSLFLPSTDLDAIVSAVSNSFPCHRSHSQRRLAYMRLKSCRIFCTCWSLLRDSSHYAQLPKLFAFVERNAVGIRGCPSNSMCAQTVEFCPASGHLSAPPSQEASAA